MLKKILKLFELKSNYKKKFFFFKKKTKLTWLEPKVGIPEK